MKRLVGAVRAAHPEWAGGAKELRRAKGMLEAERLRESIGALQVGQRY